MYETFIYLFLFLFQYRDLAPESLSDEALLELVRSNGKNDAAIKEALVTLWNGMKNLLLYV